MVCLQHRWGSDILVKIPVEVEKAVSLAKTAQILRYVRENQLLTALCLFVLWQTGAFLSVMGHAQGAVC